VLSASTFYGARVERFRVPRRGQRFNPRVDARGVEQFALGESLFLSVPAELRP
jgi:hypothetical protein